MSDDKKIQDELEVITPSTKSFIRAGFGCGIGLFTFLIWIIGISIGTEIFRFKDGSVTGIGPNSSIAEFLFSLILCYSAWLIIDRRKVFKEVGLRLSKWSVPHWLLGTISGLAGVGIALLVIYLFGSISVTSGSPPPLYNPNPGPFTWLQITIMLILYAGAEEIYARGFLYPFLKRYTGFIGAVIFSSIIFSLLHLGNNAFGFLPMIDIFLAGVLFALLREYTGNLWLAWGVHFGWNFGQVAVGLPVSGVYFYVEPQSFIITTEGAGSLTGGEFGIEGGYAGIAAMVVMIAITVLLLVIKKRKLISRNNPVVPES